MLTEVTNPDLLIVATGVVPEATAGTLHKTDGLLVVLPSLLVPNAVICTVLLVLPVSMVGVAGPTESDDIVGLTKNPLQLMASANVASMAQVHARRSF